MYRNSNAFTLSILFTLLAILLVSTLYLNKIASASLDNTMNSKSLYLHDIGPNKGFVHINVETSDS